MKMQELEGKTICINANSITVKDDAGKTRGIVRNTKTRKSLVSRELFDWASKFRKMGLAFNINYVIADNEPYYIHDLNGDEFYQKHCVDHPGCFESSIKHYNAEQETVAKAKAAGVKVVNCYVHRSANN